MQLSSLDKSVCNSACSVGKHNASAGVVDSDRPCFKKVKHAMTDNTVVCPFRTVTEDGILFEVLSYLEIKDHVRIRRVSHDLSRVVKNMPMETLCLRACDIEPEMMSLALASILHCYHNVSRINTCGQIYLCDKELLCLVSRYWYSVKHIVANDCVSLSDHTLQSIFDASSPQLQSISFRRCKLITGNFAPLQRRGSFPLLQHLDLRDTSISYHFTLALEEKFSSLKSIDALHTPAHHQFFVAFGWSDLIMSLASLALRGFSRRGSLEAMITDFHDRLFAVEDHNLFTASLLSAPDTSLVTVPLDAYDLSTVLHLASEDGRLSVTKLFLQHGVDFQSTDKEGASALFVAASFGKAKIVKCLLAAGAHADQRTLCLSSPLTIACELGHSSTVSSLLAINPRQLSQTSRSSAFCSAARNSYTTVIASLLKNASVMADVLEVDIINAMFFAVEAGNYSLLKKLAYHRPDLIFKTLPGNVSLLYVAAQIGHDRIADFLLRNGVNPDLARDNGVTSLYIACQEGQYKTVLVLLEAGAVVSTSLPDQSAPLHIAARMGNTEIIELLLEYGTDLNATTKCGMTALFIASQEGHDSVVQCLLRHGPQLEMQILDGATALFVASQTGRTSIITQLLDAKALTETSTHSGATPLHVAAQMGHHEIAHILVSRGASIHAFTPHGGSPIELANKFGHRGISETLMQYWKENMSAI